MSVHHFKCDGDVASTFATRKNKKKNNKKYPYHRHFCDPWNLGLPFCKEVASLINSLKGVSEDYFDDFIDQQIRKNVDQGLKGLSQVNGVPIM